MKPGVKVLQNSGPQPFCHQGPVLRKTIFLRTVVEKGRDGSGSNVSGGELSLLAYLLAHCLTSCCAAWFLTGWYQGLQTSAPEEQNQQDGYVCVKRKKI